MFATLFSATLLFVVTIQGALAEFTINTITLKQCSSAHVTWNQATKPYNLAVVPEGDPCNTILVDLGDHDGLSMTWSNVTLRAGTKVMFSLLDSQDNEAWSGTMTVEDGDDSCLPVASSAISAASSAVSSAISSAVSSSEVNSFSGGSATALVLTTSFPDGSATFTATSETESATIVGAANAGTLPLSSGAMSNVHLPGVATAFGFLVAIAASLAL